MDPRAAHAMLAAPDPLAAFLAERQLWGDLAGRPELAEAIQRATQRVSEWIASLGTIPA